ncbi:hypothetical protein [Peribacillus sp. FSL R5-0717]|uniref:hypothetical protein n=1 Tax=Peribacillus sp. FSL R5-0717 TaxID=2975308 RepID=UPI0030F67C29
MIDVEVFRTLIPDAQHVLIVPPYSGSGGNTNKFNTELFSSYEGIIIVNVNEVQVYRLGISWGFLL